MWSPAVAGRTWDTHYQAKGKGEMKRSAVATCALAVLLVLLSAGAYGQGPSAAAAQSGWERKSIGEVSVMVPPGWTLTQSGQPGEGAWILAEGKQPAAGLGVIFGATLDNYRVSLGEAKGKVVSIGGRSAVQFSGPVEAPYTGSIILIVMDAPEADGRRMAIAAGAQEAAWPRCEPVLKAMLATVQIGGAGGYSEAASGSGGASLAPAPQVPPAVPPRAQASSGLLIVSAVVVVGMAVLIGVLILLFLRKGSPAPAGRTERRP
jgi:hypothetical protein